MSVKERLKEFVASTNKSVRNFESEVGLSNGYINNIKNSISKDKLDKISMLFPDLNQAWLLLGEGQMLRNSPSSKSSAIDLGPLQGTFETHQTKSGNTYQIVGDGNYRFEVKVIEQLAYAGYLSGWADPEYIESLPSTVITVKKFHTGTYRVFEVKGDSMDCDRKYAIENGDCVIGHKVEKDLWRSKLHIKDWAEWVIVSDEGIIIKHILHHDVEHGVLICRSYNEDKDMYPDFELSLDSVYELYNVVKVEKSRLG